MALYPGVLYLMMPLPGMLKQENRVHRRFLHALTHAHLLSAEILQLCAVTCHRLVSHKHQSNKICAPVQHLISARSITQAEATVT